MTQHRLLKLTWESFATHLWSAGELHRACSHCWDRTRSNGAADVPKYRTESVTRGNLDVKVSATGTLQPTHKVEVGSELSGLIETVFVDENDTVKKGQELARLDCPYQKRRKRCAD